MRYNTNSVFPNNIDPLIFFSDADLHNCEQLQHYYDLINENKFSQASNYMHNSDLHYYGADLLNLIENRLYATEEYCRDYVQDKNILVIHTDDEKEPVTEISQDTASWVGTFSKTRMPVI